MVGFNPYAEVKLSALDYSVAGVVSGVATRVVIQPLDVLKIRFQLQVDPIKKQKGKYHGLRQAVRLIHKEEGLLALWKGHMPAQGLSVIFGVVQFGSFELLTRYAWNYLPKSLTTEYYPITHFACGGLAGALGMTAALPMDVLRTRFIAQGEPKLYSNVSDACYQMMRKEGPISFYRGFIPTIVQIAPYTGFQFCFYTIFVHYWRKLIQHKGPKEDPGTGFMESLICGSMGGTCAKIVVYPLDVLKKRLQIIGFENARGVFGTVHTYNGLFHCIRSILKHEGASGMFKGLIPSLITAAIKSGAGFVVYEQMCRFLAGLHANIANNKVS